MYVMSAPTITRGSRKNQAIFLFGIVLKGLAIWRFLLSLSVPNALAVGAFEVPGK